MATEITCEISDDDIEAWWNAFSNGGADAGNTGVVQGDALLIFGADPNSQFQGNADLSSGNINRIIGPAINTLAETKEVAEKETNSSHVMYARIKKQTGGIKNLKLQRRYTYIENSPFADSKHSDGQWLCIPAGELESQDKIEFAAEGANNFKTSAVWVVLK